MGYALAETAATLGCSERTLRRYIGDGLLHGRKLDRYRYELPLQEQRYAQAHWGLLRDLRAALRTERDVRLAVLFGSASTGQDSPASDVDLMIAHRRESLLALAALQHRLNLAVGKKIHLVSLPDAQLSANLMTDILCEGRVVIDRDARWPPLAAAQARVREMAISEDETLIRLAGASIRAARLRLVSDDSQ